MATEVLTSPILQYGSLGALVVFLVLFMVWQRDHDKKSDERQSQTNDFIQGLVNRALETQDVERDAWQELTRASLSAQEKGVEVMLQVVACVQTIGDTIDKSEDAARARHTETLEKIAGLRSLSSALVKEWQKQSPTTGGA